MPWLKENWFKVGILLVLLTIALSLSYYFIIRPYQNDRPYRECLKTIDPNAAFVDVAGKYARCEKLR